VPTPSRTSLVEIVAAGRRTLESDGLDGLTMLRVAEAVGVRAPSLYKHVRGRGDLVRLIAEDAARQLGAELDAATTGRAREDLRAQLEAFRAFAHAHPAAYGLLFAALPEAWRPDAGALARSSEAALRTATALAGPDRALEAARTVVAWAHGFVSMELAGAFRLGGDVDAAFAFGVERLGIALARR
jgi:AcrR family transcriptional regulator